MASSNDDQYNVFLNNNHTGTQEKIMLKFNYRVVEHIAKQFGGRKKKLEVLELGVGKGYFAQACLTYNKTNANIIKYSAFDRNKDMLTNLAKFDKSIQTFRGELPEMTIKTTKKFDVVYCAFVVEHMKNGDEVHELISNIKKVLNKDGLIVFFTPNALSQGFEFYNIDYTHSYPTTARNVTMAFNDCDVTDVTCLKINGLCTYKNFDKTIVRLVHKAAFLPYSYRLFSIIFKPVYRVPLYSLNNFFYRVFCFFKEENLMFIAKNDG